jgi:hypothetical protein
VAECPLDEMNRPRATVEPQLRVPPAEAEIDRLFAGWREELATCRKFAPAARNYAAARLEADVGLRVNEVRMLDLDDVRWDLGRFGKLNVRHGKGARRKGPKPRLVPLINGADHNLSWFIGDVRGQLGDDHERPGAPLFPSGRKTRDGSSARATDDVFRPVAGRGRRTPPARLAGKLTPHVLRHFCASQLPVRDDLVRHPGATRTFLDRDNGPVCPRARHPRRGRLGGRAAARRRPMEGTRPVKWNLRLATANRGISKASELQKMLGARGMVISAREDVGPVVRQPEHDPARRADVICAVLGCGSTSCCSPSPARSRSRHRKALRGPPHQQPGRSPRGRVTEGRCRPSATCQLRKRPPPLDHRGNDPAMTLALANGCDTVPYLLDSQPLVRTGRYLATPLGSSR